MKILESRNEIYMSKEKVAEWYETETGFTVAFLTKDNRKCGVILKLILMDLEVKRNRDDE